MIKDFGCPPVAIFRDGGGGGGGQGAQFFVFVHKKHGKLWFRHEF